MTVYHDAHCQLLHEAVIAYWHADSFTSPVKQVQCHHYGPGTWLECGDVFANGAEAACACQVQVSGKSGSSRHAASNQAPAINPVGASSNYSSNRLQPVPGKAQPGHVVAAPSSRKKQPGSHAIHSSSVDTAKHGNAATASKQVSADGVASQLDQPGLSGPQDSALPAYQLESQDRSGGQKGGARDLNKPQDPVGTAVEPGTNVRHGPAVGSAERPIHVTGAPDVPHGAAIEPSYNQGPAQNSPVDKSFQQAAKAFAVSPTEAEAKQ